MVLVKVLERKDAASLVAAVATSIPIGFFAMEVASNLSAWLFGNQPNMSLVDHVLQPVVALVVSLVLLEGLARVFIAARSSMGNKG